MEIKAYNNSKKVSLRQRIDDAIAKRNQLNERIARLEEIEEVWNNLPFKEGDAAFHKDHGNVLIRSVEFRDATEKEEETIFYNIVTISYGVKKVHYKEVVPISNTTDLLFGKKNDAV